MNMVNDAGVQIFIMSRNRKDYLLQSLESVLAVEYANMEIIVSDNSTQSEARQLLSDHPQKSRFKVIHRNDFSYLDHMNTILDEVSAPYFMVFHDDDILLPQSVSIYIKIMQQRPDIAAVGGNAEIIRNSILTKQKFMNLQDPFIVKTGADFIKRYFLHVNAHPAFPTYLYRREKVGKIRLSAKSGGVHSDSSFLYELALSGGLYFAPDVVARYRFHGQNISAKINVRDLNKMTRHFISLQPQMASVMLNYKYLIWVKYYLIQKIKKSGFGFRESVLFYRFCCYFLLHPFVFLTRLMSKLRAGE